MENSAGEAIARTAVIVSAAFLLTGCIPADGPVSIGTLDGDFRVAVCEELVVERVVADFLEPGQASEEAFWEATGQTIIPAGTILNLADDSFGMELGLYSEPSFTAGTRIWFMFFGKPDPNTGTIAEFSVPDGGVEDGLWLTPDGDIQQTPCE